MWFDAQQQRNLPAELTNCEVNSSQHGEGYEVMLKKWNSKSPKKMTC
jgi:hypothetical protein